MTGTVPAPTLPAAVDLDGLDDAGFARALAPLFEGAPGFLARLAAGRPYGSYAALLERARRVAHEMPEEAQLELIDSHPRIGAPPGSVSPLSYAEQGYDRDRADAAAELERARIDEALRRGNAAYEARFGFRFVVFVAGRPRSAIVPVLEERLDAGRDDEIGRALDDVISIAGDRIRKLRGQEAS
jgi:2-oxo-4-hydroxy-4-carboxy--5-ureidoimidazoline (OHCU) decarboxylase